METYYRCWAEVSLPAIRHNLMEAKKRLDPAVKTLAVIKADAYGHGAVRVGKYIEDISDFFAVATAKEAEELRTAGIRIPILILGYTSAEESAELVRLDIRPAVYSVAMAEALDLEAGKQRKKAGIHIALDTGMTRIGYPPTEGAADEIARISRLPNIEIEGIFSHFSCADMTDKAYTSMQAEAFERMLEMLGKRGVRIPVRHICNSAGIMDFADYRYDMVRAGIILYGIYPSEEVIKENLDLQPALSWKARVVHVKEVGPGTSVGYGASWTADKKTKIATVSAGYADGYPRALSNRGRVLIRGQYAPIIGRVCMDLFMVDVSEIPDVRTEDVVTLIGRDGDGHIPVEEVADPAGRFNYEMLCNISARVPRVYSER